MSIQKNMNRHEIYDVYINVPDLFYSKNIPIDIPSKFPRRTSIFFHLQNIHTVSRILKEETGYKKPLITKSHISTFLTGRKRF